MKLYYIFTFTILIILNSACSIKNNPENSTAKYTYGIEGWENLGSQTLVMLDASNPSKLNQDLIFTIEVTNKEGKKFIKDTTVHFESNENNKDFQLLLDTEGEIDTVTVIAIDV